MDNQHSGRMANSWHFTPCSQTPHFELLLCISEKNTLNNSKHRQAKEQTNGLRRNKGAPKRNRPIVTTHFSSPAFSFARNSSRHFSCVNSLSTNFWGCCKLLNNESTIPAKVHHLLLIPTLLKGLFEDALLQGKGIWGTCKANQLAVIVLRILRACVLKSGNCAKASSALKSEWDILKISECDLPAFRRAKGCTKVQLLQSVTGFCSPPILAIGCVGIGMVNILLYNFLLSAYFFIAHAHLYPVNLPWAKSHGFSRPASK